MILEVLYKSYHHREFLVVLHTEIMIAVTELMAFISLSTYVVQSSYKSSKKTFLWKRVQLTLINQYDYLMSNALILFGRAIAKAKLFENYAVYAGFHIIFA